MLRGHQNDATANLSKNQGNFISLEVEAASGDVVLQEHLQSASKDATYASKTIQNEHMDTLSAQIRSRILEKVMSAEYFSILADEITAISLLE